MDAIVAAKEQKGEYEACPDCADIRACKVWAGSSLNEVQEAHKTTELEVNTQLGAEEDVRTMLASAVEPKQLSLGSSSLAPSAPRTPRPKAKAKDVSPQVEP